MKVPKEYYDVHVVHVGCKIYDMFTDPEEASKATGRLLDQNVPAEMTAGLEEYGRVCQIRGMNQPQLTMSEA